MQNGYKEIKEIKINTATATEEIISNIKTNLRIGYKSIETTDEFRKLRSVAVVGGGPSLTKTIKSLFGYNHGYNKIIACGSVYDYLVNNYIYPDYCVICDPDPIVNEYIQKSNSAFRTKFLVASQCSPKTFEFLENRGINPIIWNAAANENNEEIFGKGQIALGGGCTVGTRGIVIASCMGYETIDLFGFDNCVTDEGSHAYAFSDPEKEKITKLLDISIGDVKFKMAEYHLGQLMDFKALLATSLKHINFNVHGDGAIKTLFELGRKGVK